MPLIFAFIFRLNRINSYIRFKKFIRCMPNEREIYCETWKNLYPSINQLIALNNYTCKLCFDRLGADTLQNLFDGN